MAVERQKREQLAEARAQEAGRLKVNVSSSRVYPLFGAVPSITLGINSTVNVI